MTQTLQKLQKIKGLGPIFSKRFLEAGYDTAAKIVAAGKEGLSKIEGMNAKVAASILAQASELAGEGDKTRTEKVKELKQKAASVMKQVQDIALNVPKRFPKADAGKRGKKVKKEIAKIMTSLKKVEGRLQIKMKRTGKVLFKAEETLACLTDAGLKRLEKGLRKTRKSLKKNLPA